MTLLVGSRQIADCRLQTVSLRPMVGGYEMVFALHLSVSPGEDGLPKANIDGARITANPTHGNPQPLGFARPEQPANITCMPHASTATPSLHLYLQPTQIDSIRRCTARQASTHSITERVGPLPANPGAIVQFTSQDQSAAPVAKSVAACSSGSATSYPVERRLASTTRHRGPSWSTGQWIYSPPTCHHRYGLTCCARRKGSGTG